jgi:hypothetical protein
VQPRHKKSYVGFPYGKGFKNKNSYVARRESCIQFTCKAFRLCALIGSKRKDSVELKAEYVITNLDLACHELYIP